jgi:hypothetical protein
MFGIARFIDVSVIPFISGMALRDEVSDIPGITFIVSRDAEVRFIALIVSRIGIGMGIDG